MWKLLHLVANKILRFELELDFEKKWKLSRSIYLYLQTGF